MEIDTDANDALDPSAGATLDDATTTQPVAGSEGGADGVGSSAAQGDNQAEPSTLDIVRDVVGKGREAGAASPAEGQEGQGKDPTKPGADKQEADDENYSDVPFHKHPRFQHLLRAKKANEADAAQYRNVQTFMDNNGLTPAEAAEGFAIMAAMKQDPVKAWEMLRPHVQSLLQAAGEVLPEKFAARVQSGELTPEAAREIAKAEARAAAVETGRTFDQQRQERQRQREAGEALVTTAQQWLSDRSAKDPNFEAKQQPLAEKIAWLQKTEGVPNTPDGVKAQLDKAYKMLAPVAVRPRQAVPTVGSAARRPAPASGGQQQQAQPKPTSTLDIVNSVLAKRGSAG